METDRVTSIEGTSAAAILMLLLEDSAAADVLRYLDADEVRELGGAMFGAAEADEKNVEHALAAFVTGSRDVSLLSPGADRKIRNVMTEALGNVRADNLLSTIAPQNSQNVLDLLRWMDSDSIASVVAIEHPQVASVILAVLTPEAAAKTLHQMDPSKQVDLLIRAAKLQTIRAEAIEDLESILRTCETAREQTSQISVGGEQSIAKVVNNLSRNDAENILRLMRKKDKIVAAAIEEEMFVFEDLNKLDAKTLGAVLRSIDASVLAVALKGADSALSDRFLATMSARAADTIRDDIAEMAPVKREDVEAARRQVTAVARAMAASGEIMIGGGSDEFV